MDKQIGDTTYYYEEFGQGTPIIFFSGFATDLSFLKKIVLNLFLRPTTLISEIILTIQVWVKP